MLQQTHVTLFTHLNCSLGASAADRVQKNFNPAIQTVVPQEYHPPHGQCIAIAEQVLEVFFRFVQVGLFYANAIM